MGVVRRGSRWYLDYWEDGRRIRRSLGSDIRTRAQAEAVWRKIDRERRARRIGLLDPSRVTLQAFADEYISHRAALPLSPATKRQDAKALKSLMDYLGGSCLLRSITQRRLEQWAAHLTQLGRSPHTIRSYLSHILAALELAVEWGSLREMPRIKRRRVVRTPEVLPRTLLPEEVERLLASERDPERRALWTFLVWTGLRRQEAYDLVWQRVHLDDDEPWCQVIGKGGKERLVPLLPAAVDALRVFGPADVGPVFSFTPRPRTTARRPSPERLRELLESGLSYVQIGRMLGVSDVTVARWARQPLRRYRPRPDTISHWLKQAMRAAGIEGARLHDLRHTAATWMAARGVPEHIIQAVMGHASIITTQRYTQGVARVAHLYRLMSTGLPPQD